MAVLHHPAVLDIPFLESYSTAAKLFYLSAVSVSDNPLIKEITFLHSSSAFQKEVGITLATTNALLLAKESLSDINKLTLTKASKAIWRGRETQKWEDCLSKLIVQNKFVEACRLECENKVWSSIQQGLPVGQLSSIAGSFWYPTYSYEPELFRIKQIQNVLSAAPSLYNFT